MTSKWKRTKCEKYENIVGFFLVQNLTQKNTASFRTLFVRTQEDLICYVHF